MSTATSDPITSFLTLGEETADPIKEPAVDATGSVVLEPGESEIWSGSAQVTIAVFRESSSWRGTSRGWQNVMAPKTQATVTLTTERVLLTWPDWRKDSALGSFFERRMMMAAMERGMGKQVLGGHLRHRWIDDVFTAKARDRAGLGRLRLDIQHASEAYAVSIPGFRRDEEQRIGRELVSTIAASRLVDGAALSDEARGQLEALRRRPQASDTGWGQRYQLPGAVSFGK